MEMAVLSVRVTLVDIGDLLTHKSENPYRGR
jgi:hypothetical protein